MYQPLLRILLSVALLLWLASRSAWASPPDSVWVEDVMLHPAGPAELTMGYDFIEPDMDLLDAGIDLITLRTAAGFDRAPLDFQPRLTLVQAGLDEVRIAHFGARVRYRLLGTPKEPSLGLLVGYQLELLGDRAHDLEQGLAGRAYFSRVFSLGYEFRVRERVGDGEHVEVRAGLALTRGMAIDLVRFGVEAFVLVPVVGDRLTDYGAGGDPGDFALYAGPSLRVHAEYLWITISAVTGRILPEDGADVMVRAALGTQF